MSAPSSKSSQPTPTTFNERLNEQLVNCLNVQTNVIQNLAQYSQHISLQLFEIKNVVELLSNRVLALQQQQQQQQQSHFPPNYAASYYPPYMHPPPPPMPIPHPPPSSHPPPPVPFSVPQAQVQMRLPTTTTTAPTAGNLPFFSQNIANTQQPTAPPPISTASSQISSNASPFQFSTSAPVQPPTQQQSQQQQQQKPNTTTIPSATTTTPSKSIFSNPPVFSLADMVSKPISSATLFPTTTTNSSNEKPAASSIFSFGTTNTSTSSSATGFSFGLPNTSTIKQETHADDNGEDEDPDDSYEPDTSFQPIVTLKPVEVKTGEEDENVLFCERGKLYRFDTASNQMKERGIGEMKILQHKTTKLCRILMRREQVLKLCANHTITSQMDLKPHQGTENAYVWSAMDFADGEAKHETLCIRFKTDEQAKKFAKVFNEAKGMTSKKSGDSTSASKTSSNDQDKTKSSTNDDDVISIGEVKPSAEQIDRAKKLQLPSTFYLYENKEPCKGCPGCEGDTPPAETNENKPTTITNKQTDAVKNDTNPSTPQTPSTASAPKTPLTSSENNKFSFTNADKPQTPQLQKQTSATATKEDKTSTESSTPNNNISSQYDNKPSIFGNFNGSPSTSIFGSSTPNGSIFGGAPSIKPANNTGNGFAFPGFGNTTATTPSSGFQFSTPSATSTSASTTTTTTASTTSAPFSFGTTANAPLFGNAPKFSFADLAKQSPSNDKPSTNGTEQRVFAGQGSLVFGTNAANVTTTTTTTGNNNDDDDGEGGGEDDSYEPNVSFKPIVQLSAVEVKTGEEDEEILFCERGKLYRFDPEANQMKERGIGEMKILQHKTTKLCRILMRREQVLKLCANHTITSQMELKPHQGTENAYVWSAMDFADGEAKHETLCIRFKSSETAKRFLKIFNEAKETNAQAH